MDTKMTIRLGEVSARLTELAARNPTAFLRAAEAVEKEFKATSTQTLSATLADAQAAINRMGEPGRQAAADQVAELEREWARTRVTLSATQLQALHALEGDNPVRLMMRWRLIEQTRAAGRDPRTMGGL